jgi:polyhydroxybutyrate depolymerase
MAERRFGALAEGWFATGMFAMAIVVLAASCSSSSSRSTSTSTVPSASTTTSNTTPTTPPAAACARPHAAGQFAQTFDYKGVIRTYQLYVPRAYLGTAEVPVVFDFHGFGSNAVQQMAYGNFKPLADRHDFLIIAPDGQGAARHFNLGGEQGLQNDIAMVVALLDHIEATFCVDEARVYSTGMSDGGAMTSVLACVAANRFAAFGAVAVEIYRAGCGGTRPVSIVAFHGTADPVVPFDGGKVQCCSGALVGSAPGAMAGWAAHDHCGPAFVDARLGSQVRRRIWSGCDGASSVVFYMIDGGGHTWPGSIPLPRLGLTTTQIDASATIWAFFAAHPLQS